MLCFVLVCVRLLFVLLLLFRFQLLLILLLLLDWLLCFFFSRSNFLFVFCHRQCLVRNTQQTMSQLEWGNNNVYNGNVLNAISKCDISYSVSIDKQKAVPVWIGQTEWKYMCVCVRESMRNAIERIHFDLTLKIFRKIHKLYVYTSHGCGNVSSNHRNTMRFGTVELVHILLQFASILNETRKKGMTTDTECNYVSPTNGYYAPGKLIPKRIEMEPHKRYRNVRRISHVRAKERNYEYAKRIFLVS